VTVKLSEVEVWNTLTYKIISPLYSAEEMIPNDIDFPLLPEEQPVINSGQELIDFLVTTQLREEQVQICYNTIKSNEILLANTNELVEDRLDKHRVRFIGRDNPEIIHRYSILVKQYVQSIEAYRFYETLKMVMNVGSLILYSVMIKNLWQL